MKQTTRYNEYAPTTGRMTELDSNDPRLTARMPAAKVVKSAKAPSHCGFSMTALNPTNQQYTEHSWYCTICGVINTYVVDMPITADERKAAMAARFAARS